MRVVIICDSELEIGGAEKHARELHSELRKKNIEVHTITWASDEKKNRILIKKSFPVNLWKLVPNPYIIWKIRKQLKRLKPEVIHVHNITTCMPSVFLAIKKWRCIVTVHDFGAVCPDQWNTHKDGTVCTKLTSNCFLKHRKTSWLRFVMLSAFYFLRKNLMIRTVSATISPSPFLTKYLKNLKYPNVITLPHYVEMKNKNFEDKNKEMIMYVGALEENKGINILLEEFKKTKKNFKLHIFGRGSLEKKIKKKSKNIIFHGWKDPSSSYKKAAILVAPSICTESFGYSVVEALQQGCTVIASNRGTFPWLLGNTGKLFDPLQKGSLAEALNSIELEPEKSIIQGEKFNNKEEYIKKLVNIYGKS